MTIGEAVNRFWQDGDDVTNIEDLIKEVYNDFDSRTCENCKYCFKVQKYDTFCKELYRCVPKDFGCSEFERKTDNG